MQLFSKYFLALLWDSWALERLGDFVLTKLLESFDIFPTKLLQMILPLCLLDFTLSTLSIWTFEVHTWTTMPCPVLFSVKMKPCLKQFKNFSKLHQHQQQQLNHFIIIHHLIHHFTLVPLPPSLNPPLPYWKIIIVKFFIHLNYYGRLR